MTLHYFSDGTCHLMFARNKEQYFVPVVMVLKVSQWGVLGRVHSSMITNPMIGLGHRLDLDSWGHLHTGFG